MTSFTCRHRTLMVLLAGWAGCSSGGTGRIPGASGGAFGRGGTLGAIGGGEGSAGTRGASGGTSAGDGGASAGSGGASGGNGGTAGMGGASGGSSGPLSCAGIPVTSQLPRLKNNQYDAVVKDLLGVTTLTTAGNVRPSALLAPDSVADLTEVGWATYLTVAETIAGEVMAGANKSRFMTCDPAVGTCLTDTIKTFGRKAFRRPLTEAEVTRFQRLDMVTPKGPPTEVAESILFAFLASPSFITLSELSPTKEGNAFRLSSFEVATRLSFLLWGSIPDDLLNTAADADKLTTKDQIWAQAQRMLKVNDAAGIPKAAPVMNAFHRAYAGVEAGYWGRTTHDPVQYPAYSKDADVAMMGELDAFFQEVAFAGVSYRDLFLKNVGFVNKSLAPYYGLDPASYGTELKKVTLDQTDRPGFLTRVAFLSSFSSYGATNPITRGTYIATRVLGLPFPPPPLDTGPLPPPGLHKTQRDRVTALTAQAACAGCHDAMNAPGFVLERYDAIGGLQTIDRLGGVIDGTADVTFAPMVKKTIKSPLELMTELSKTPEVRHHYAEQFVTYATGRAPNTDDTCLVDQLNNKLAQDSYPVLNLLPDYTQADSFRLRVAGN
jgi:hypothetical protein